VKKVDLANMNLDQLVDRFADIGVAQDDALWDGKYAKFNRLYDRMDEIDQELRSRGEEARLALLRLYNHRNMQVRLKAAVHTLAVAPELARHALQTIANSKFYPQAGDAGMLLSGLDDGSFHPQ
jgi:Domain of unknown function (DUF2019)